MKELGWAEIPAVVFESNGGNDDWFMLSENIQRDDLTDSEKGEAIQGLDTVSRLSNVKLAAKLGVSEFSVRLWLKAAGYPDEVKQMTKDGTVTDKALSPIASLATPQEQLKTAEYIRDNDLGYVAAKATVDAIIAAFGLHNFVPPFAATQWITNGQA